MPSTVNFGGNNNNNNCRSAAMSNFPVNVDSSCCSIWSPSASLASAAGCVGVGVVSGDEFIMSSLQQQMRMADAVASITSSSSASSSSTNSNQSSSSSASSASCSFSAANESAMAAAAAAATSYLFMDNMISTTNDYNNEHQHQQSSLVALNQRSLVHGLFDEHVPVNNNNNNTISSLSSSASSDSENTSSSSSSHHNGNQN